MAIVGAGNSPCCSPFSGQSVLPQSGPAVLFSPLRSVRGFGGFLLLPLWSVKSWGPWGLEGCKGDLVVPLVLEGTSFRGAVPGIAGGPVQS